MTKKDILAHISVSEKGLILGQYDGYRDHSDTLRTSSTETYVALAGEYRDERVHFPIFLRSGKHLYDKSTVIYIRFSLRAEEKYGYRAMVIDITEDSVYLIDRENTKKSIALESRDFCRMYHLDAHETLFLDVMEGNKAYFLHPDEILESWKIVSPTLQVIGKKPQPHIYELGSFGPKEAEHLTNWYHPTVFLG